MSYTCETAGHFYLYQVRIYSHKSTDPLPRNITVDIVSMLVDSLYLCYRSYINERFCIFLYMLMFVFFVSSGRRKVGGIPKSSQEEGIKAYIEEV